MTINYTGGRVPQWTLQDRLRKAREMTGMDQSQFADHVGISRNTVRNYETGKTSRMSRPMLAAWAMATGVPLVWLETGEAPEPGGDGPGQWWAPRGSNPEPTVSESGPVGAGLGRAHGAGAAA